MMMKRRMGKKKDASMQKNHYVAEKGLKSAAVTQL